MEDSLYAVKLFTLEVVWVGRQDDFIVRPQTSNSCTLAYLHPDRFHNFKEVLGG